VPTAKSLYGFQRNQCAWEFQQAVAEWELLMFLINDLKLSSTVGWRCLRRWKARFDSTRDHTEDLKKGACGQFNVAHCVNRWVWAKASHAVLQLRCHQCTPFTKKVPVRALAG